MDLIDNAAKYSDAESLITLILHSHTDGIAIDVQDEGIGIPASDLPHIFKRFYRGKTVVTTVERDSDFQSSRC